MSDEQKPIDWGSIRNDWEKSDKSIRWLADWYSISEGAIRKKARKESWPERSKAERKPVRADDPRTEAVTIAGIDASDPEQIVGRGHNLIFRLLTELDAATTHGNELAEMIEAHEEDPRRRAAMLKAVSLGGRADVVKALALAFKTWNEGKAPAGKKAERQAKAEEAAGKFAPRTRPAIVVNNG